MIINTDYNISLDPEVINYIKGLKLEKKPG